MSLAPKQKYIHINKILSPAIRKSDDLRLPERFKKLDHEYIEGEFVGVSAEVPIDEIEIMTMNDAAMFPTIAVDAKLVVDMGMQPKHNDIVMAEYYGQLICRRIFISKRKSWLYGDDKDFTFIDLSKNAEVVILGVVTSHYINHNAVKYA